MFIMVILDNPGITSSFKDLSTPYSMFHCLENSIWHHIGSLAYPAATSVFDYALE